ncbi:MAG: tetratricopeptide repeat protein [Kiloniellales bacterium]|nr:tetratricopeptide repeat protein [Kiloniellales bacterium]
MTQNVQQLPTTAEFYELARNHQSAGDLERAKRLYGQILLSVPHHAESLTMLASIAYQQGDDVQAEAYLDQAVKIYRAVLDQMPQNLRVRAPLANLLLARGKLAEAEAAVGELMLPLNPIRATPETFVARRRSGIDRGLPTMVINTVPKSASESIWNQLAEGLGLGQCHLSLGLYPDCCLIPARVHSAAEGGLVVKEHIRATPHNVGQLAQEGLNRLVFHVRDPRQATLSWAHFVHDDVSMRLMGPVWRKIVPSADTLRADLSGLIDWCIEQYLPLLIEFMAGWIELERDSSSPLDLLFLTFEKFRTEPDAYFGEILRFYDIDPKLFASDAQADVVHLRKGLLDEWREVFSPDQQARAWSLIPKDMATAFGWEP